MAVVSTHVQKTLEKYPGLRRIVSNIGWMTFDYLMRATAGVLVGAWVARYLGPGQYGQLNYAMAIVALLSVLVPLGLDMIVKRELVRTPEARDVLLGTVFFLRLGTGILLYLVLFVYSRFIEDATSRWLLVILGGTVVNLSCSTIDLWFQSQTLSKYTVWAQNISFGLLTGVRVILILSGMSLLYFAVVVLVEALLDSLFLAFFYHKRGEVFRRWRFNHKTAKGLLSQSWPLIFSSFAYLVYLKIDLVMIKMMRGTYEVGIYAAAARISELFFFIPGALAVSLFPTLVRSKEQEKRVYYNRIQAYFDLSVALAYGLSVVMSLATHFVITTLYGRQYEAASQVLVIHIWSNVFIFLQYARGGVLVTEDLILFSLISNATGAIVNIVLNIILIPRAGAVGSAIATLISYSIAGLWATFFYHKTRHIGMMQLRALGLTRWITWLGERIR